MSDFTRTVADGIGGLIGGAVTAVGDAFWAIVGVGQSILPGPIFPILVLGGAFFLFLWWAFRR